MNYAREGVQGRVMQLQFLPLIPKMMFLPLFLTLTLVLEGSALTPTRYMLSYCKQRNPILYLNDSLILELSNNVIGNRKEAVYKHCKLKVRVTPTRHILLQFFELRITDTHGTPDRLQIFDNVPDGKKKLLTPLHGAYGIYPGERSRGVQDYNSSYNELELNYFGRPTVEAPGFKLLLTPFIKELTRRKCPDGYFHCSITRICIRSSLACDGYQNCGTKDGSDEGKCRYYAEGQKSKSIFQGPVLLALIVSVVAIVVFIGVALIIMLLTRRFNRRSMAKLKTARKRRRAQDYTSTNNLTQNYDPPPYEDVIRTVNNPPSYNITSDEATATDSGPGEGGKLSPIFAGGEDDEKRKMMLMMMMMKNGQQQQEQNHLPHHHGGPCCGGACGNKYRNDHIALTQQKLNPDTDDNYDVNQPLKVALPPPKSTKDPLRKGPVNHVHNCSVTIESPVSSSTATYSHRISSYSNHSSNSNSSSNNDFEQPCDQPGCCGGEYPNAYHDDMVYMNNHLGDDGCLNNHLGMNGEDGCYDEHDEQNGGVLEGATAASCCPAVIPTLSENGICNDNIPSPYNGVVWNSSNDVASATPPSPYSGIVCDSANDVASATPNAAIVLNGVVMDDDEDYEEDYEDDECLPSGTLFSEIDSFLYADGGSGSCSPQDQGTGLVASENGYQCHSNSVKLRTKNPEPCVNGNSNSSDNDECCNAVRLPQNSNMATRQCELISAEPEAVRLLQ